MQRLCSSFYACLPAALLGASCVSAGQNTYDSLASDYRALAASRTATASDERLLLGERIDRPTLIRAILRRNPTLEAARNAWSAALARYRDAGAWDDPSVRVAIAPMSIGASDARFGYEVAASQRIPLGGKQGARSTLAALEAEAVADSYREARIKLALSASQLFDDYALAVRSLEIHAEAVQLMDSLRQSASAAYESSRSAADDTLEVEAELARLQLAQTRSETERDVAVAQLDALLHRDPSARLPLPLTAADERDGGDLRSAQAIERRPDLVAARARVRVAEARAGVANSEYYPDLMLSTSYNSMWDMPQHRFVVGVELNVPLARGRRAAALDEASASRAAAESQLASMRDTAGSEAVIASREIAQARAALELYQQRLVPLARERAEAARSRFVVSQGAFAAVLEAERNLRSEQLEMERVHADLNKRVAELDASLGRIPFLESSGGQR